MSCRARDVMPAPHDPGYYTGSPARIPPLVANPRSGRQSSHARPPYRMQPSARPARPAALAVTAWACPRARRLGRGDVPRPGRSGRATN